MNLNLRGLSTPEKKERLRLAAEALAERVLNGDGEVELANYLRQKRGFHRYSAGNSLMIAIQAPDSRWVGSLGSFSRLAVEKGHSTRPFHTYRSAVAPKSGSSAVWIWGPSTHKVTQKRTLPNGETEEVEEEVTRFTLMKTFAVESLYFTDNGQDCADDPTFLPSIPVALAGDPGSLYDALLRFCEAKKFIVEEANLPLNGPDGYSTAGHKVVVRGSDTPSKKLATLIHEVAHELLHWGPQGKVAPDAFSKQTEEVEAETASYIVLEYFGLQPGVYSSAYLRSYGATPADVLASMKRVQGAGVMILNGIEDHLRQGVLSAEVASASA